MMRSLTYNLIGVVAMLALIAGLRAVMPSHDSPCIKIGGAMTMGGNC